MPHKVKAHAAAVHYGVSVSNLRKWAREGAIPAERSPGGHFIYVLPDIEPDVSTTDAEWSENIIYARVSSRKQSNDLQRQARKLVEQYPDFTLVKDIGSGINYQRHGFRAILERLFSGKIKRVVVAHKDRFTRFGFDFFEWLFERFGAILESVEQPSTNTGEDMVADIMEVFTVFTARYYGRRKYNSNKENTDLSDNETKSTIS